jgi:uncharacterized protein (DUF362 family)
MEQNDIILAYGSDSVAMTRNLLDAIGMETLVPDRHASIALKPNLVVATRPEGGATTHPSIIETTIAYLKERGYDRISIVESAWVGDSTKEGFRVNGYDRISRQFGVPLVDVKDDEYERCSADGISMDISRTILETDFLISFPVLKGHCQTNMTCALKNMKGCLSDRSKRAFHSMGLHRPIAALNAVRCADLVIVDSLNGDLDFEEGGNPVRTDRMFAARDSVLCDSFGAQLLGFELRDIPYIELAEHLGVGSTDLSEANIIQLNEPQGEKNARPRGAVASLAAHTLPDSACSACYGNLIHALKRLDEVGRLDNLSEKICIGQGYRGTTDPDKIGVGTCTRGLGKSLPGCPPKAIDMIEFIKNLD